MRSARRFRHARSRVLPNARARRGEDARAPPVSPACRSSRRSMLRRLRGSSPGEIRPRRSASARHAVSRVVVVGGGQSGLHAAAMLGAAAHVKLVERLPDAGGQEPERPHTDELAAGASRAGAVLKLATCAVSWSGAVLTTLGVEGASELEADALVIATGSRPATRGELGIGGDRCAGVLPVSAAVHLTRSGVLVGRRPAVLGGGD